MNKIKQLQRALETIDKIASLNNEDESNQVLNDIYRIAHAFSGKCEHPDWKQFEEEVANKLKDY